MSVASSAENWTVDYGKSSIIFEGTHAGNSFDGVFKHWQADIQFDPTELETSYVNILISTNSATTGNALYDGTITGEDWFNTKLFPDAVFKADSFTNKNGPEVDVAGSLTIKDKAVSLSFSMMIEITGDTAVATFEVPLSRLNFGLGTKSDPLAAWVSDEINVRVRVVASR